MALSFFGPGVRVLMVDPTAGTLASIDQSLRDDKFSLKGSPSVADFSDFMSSVELSVSSFGVTTATVVLTPPFDVLRDLLDKSELPELGYLMVIVFGYPESNDVSEPITLVMQLPSIQYDQNAQITFTGVNGSFELQRRISNRTWEVQVEPERALGIIRKIAKEIGFTVATSFETGIPDDPPDLTPKGLTDPVIWTRPITQNVSDWDFIKKLCRAGNTDLYSDRQQLILVDKDARGLAAPAVTLRMWGQIDTSRLIFPIQSFSVQNPAWFARGETTSTDERESCNPVTGQPTPPDPTKNDPSQSTITFTGPATVGAQAKPGLSTTTADGQQLTVAPKLGPLSSGKRVVKNFRDIFAGGKVQNIVREGTYGSGQTAEVKTLGIPRLQPNNLVAVQGVGERFDGVWDIVSLQHRIDGSGFFTTLQLRRNSVTGVIQESIDAATDLGQGLVIDPALVGGVKIVSPALIQRFVPVMNGRPPVEQFPDSILIPELVLAAGLNGIGAALASDL